MAPTAPVRLPWLIMHPFGRPVVPEVYTIVASVAAVTAPRRRPISSAVTSSPVPASASRPPPSSCHTASTFATCAARMAAAHRASPANIATALESAKIQRTCSTDEVS